MAVNRLTTEFISNGDGNLAKKTNPDGSKTIYVGGIYEEDKTCGGTVTGTKTYYPVAGATLAPHCVRCSAGVRVTPPINGKDLFYVLKDQLGSASLLTDDSGAPVLDADVRYLPFGEARSSTAPMLTDKLFTGQRLMADLGIYHYGARFYSPRLGRFLSADTIIPSYTNPQNLNRYSYVLNNPLRYSDPTGNRECDYDCQVEYYRADPDYEHYCEACVWDVEEQFEFEWVARTCEINGTTCWGFTPGARHIQLYETYHGTWNNMPFIGLSPITPGLILHEMGHAFNQRLGGTPMAGLGGDLLTRDNPDGFFASPYVGQLSTDTSQSEIFADMFLGWSFGEWGSGQLGLDRMNYMQDMNTWILNAAALP
jgi:RHS repeat-associated protein